MKTNFQNLIVITVFTLGFTFNINMLLAQSSKEKNNKVTIYLTRHGKTMFNTAERVQGWSDTPLTEAGVKVADDLGKGLSDTSFVTVYCSTSGRAIETTELVLAHNKRKKNIPVQLKDLREWNFGGFEGEKNSVMWKAVQKTMQVTDFKNLKLSEFSNAIAKSDTTKIAENWEKLTVRMERAIKRIAKETAAKGGGNVLVVCHGLTISTIVNILDPDRATAGPLENASVTKVSYKNGLFTVIKVGDMEYVEQGAKMK